MAIDLASLVGEAAEIFSPLANAARSPEGLARLLEALGHQRAPAVLANDVASLQVFVGRVDELMTVDLESDEAALRAALELVLGVQTALATAVATMGVGADIGQAVEELLSYSFIVHLARARPAVHAALLLAGVIKQRLVRPADPGGRDLEYVSLGFDWANLAHAMFEPRRMLTDVYGWGTAGFDAQLLIVRLARLLAALGARAGTDDVSGLLRQAVAPTMNPPPPWFADVELLRTEDDDGNLGRLGLAVLPAEGADPTDAGIAVMPFVEGSVQTSIDVIDTLQLRVEASGAIAGGVVVTARPQSGFAIKAGILDNNVGASVACGLGLIWTPAEGVPLIGSANATNLSIDDAALWLRFSPKDFGVEAGVTGGALVIQRGEGDGFLNTILPSEPMRFEFEFGIGYSHARGVYFRGGAGLEFSVPLGIEIGPVFIDRLDLAVRLSDAGLTFEAACTLGAKMAGFAVVVAGIGLDVGLRFGGRGTLGPADLVFGFKPPNGIGISLSTSTLRIGGFLKIDVERGRYYGLLEIALFEKFELVAIGLLTTKKADGTPGFSLLAIITVTFPAPIPLGYNFYLAGVGGMIGLNRSVAMDALRAGLQTGAADNVLFPTNVVERVDEIITDLETMFPEKEGQFIVGPMAKLTWNSPALITAKVGLIIEVPSPFRIGILGALRAALPNEQEPILDLKVNFLGTIDFEAGLLAFDASIYDSYFGKGSFKIWFEGDIALRICWGKKPDFLVSVGGFHPQFHPPPHLQLPPMKRLTISLLKDNPRLRLTAYFALSTNTVQFGAKLDFYFGIGDAFKIVGELGFDVLLQFSPFRFIADIFARLELIVAGVPLLGIELRFGLEGPNPWIARGKASFSILFFKVTAEFKKEFGEGAAEDRPSIEVLPMVLEELARDTNWTGELTEGKGASVQLVADDEGAKKIDGGGALVFRQKVLPLKVDFDRFGTNVTTDAGRFEIEEVRAGATPLLLQDVTEPFAPAQFRSMNDKDKLAADSYEPMPGGVRTASAGGLQIGVMKAREVLYEQQIFDGGPVVLGAAEQKLPADEDEFDRLMKGSAAARSPRGRSVARNRPRAAEVAINEEAFAVVRTSDLQPAGDNCTKLPRWRANGRLEELVAAGVSRRTLQVLPQSQIGEAA